MTDTPRTIADLQALFADNTSGDISAQDLRDFLVTVVNYLDGVLMAPTTDVVPLTIEGMAGHTQPLLLIDDPAAGSDYSDVVTIVGDKGGPNESNMFSMDSAGEVFITTLDAGASALVIFPASGSAAFGAHIVQVSTDGGGGTLLDLEANGKFSVGDASLSNGLLIRGPHAAPADAEMNAGDLMFWFDKTNGAAKLMVKAKQANGTVVTGQVALS